MTILSHDLHNFTTGLENLLGIHPHNNLNQDPNGGVIIIIPVNSYNGSGYTN